MELSKNMSIVVVSCDKYNDLWDDMFNLLDKFWPNRKYETYLATDTLNYQRPGVKVINFGKIREWMVCTRKALGQIDTPYVLFLMDDYFIVDYIKEKEIENDLSFMMANNGSYLDLQRKPDYLKTKDSITVLQHIHTIPPHTKYGICADAAIWNRKFFIEQLEKEDGDAWRFEMMEIEQSKTEKGLEGNLYYDDRMPLHICKREVVRLGKFTLDGVRIVERTGYKILSTRERMTKTEYLKDRIKSILASIKIGRKFIKRVATKMGYRFFTDD